METWRGPLALEPDPAWPRGLPLRLEGVRVRRRGGEILQGVDLAFEPGRRFVLLGASGAGKSTLLRLLNRLEDPSAGRITIGEIPLASLPIRAVRSGVGLVFQGPRPLPGTVAENLAYPFTVRGLSAPDPDRMGAALEEVGLDPSWLGREALGLSGGERQRLAMAVALGANPEILALDEPTAALDPASARRLADLLAARADRTGLRTIAVTHYREHAAWLGEEAVVLDTGRIIDRGPLDEVLRRCDSSIWAGTSPISGAP
ncbi:MAG: ATP-binding cassette domain-containing protein [Isosphaeraceae bacterium]|nr:ATP-binding cassette domain-containing protein [Isosphaeraceae bacterium]